MDYEALQHILAAELMALSPDGVSRRLAEIANESDQEWAILRGSDLATLVERNEPAIDLAIARYGQNVKAIRDVFTRHQNRQDLIGKGVRLAILANERIWVSSEHPGCPLSVLSNEFYLDEERAAEILGHLDVTEIQALFSNPAIGSNTLEKFFSLGKLWQALTSEYRRVACVWLANSGTLCARSESNAYRDDCQFDHAIKLVWSLAARVEASDEMALALGLLLQSLPANRDARLTLSGCEQLSSKWHQQGEGDDRESLDLRPYELIRCGIARSIDKIETLSSHQDRAFRAAYYQERDFSPMFKTDELAERELENAYHLDGSFFLSQALFHNRCLARDQFVRAKMNDLCARAQAAEAKSGASTRGWMDCWEAWNRDWRHRRPGWFSN